MTATNLMNFFIKRKKTIIGTIPTIQEITELEISTIMNKDHLADVLIHYYNQEN